MLSASKLRLKALPAPILALLLLGLRADPAAARLRVLVLSGMNNHDWQQTTPALQRIYQDSGRFRVDVTETPSALDAAALARYDLVVSNWTNFPNEERAWGPETEQALLDFVRAGKGLALFHAASACFPTWPEYQRLIGATWAMGTTGHGTLHNFGVTIADRGHPITRGMDDFSIHDELWHRMAVQPTAHVLCTAFSAEDTGGSGRDEPVALVTELGQGRCFNLVLGHDVTAMESPGWRLLMLRGSEWAATGRATISVPVDIGVALSAVARYRHYQSRGRLTAVELLVQRAATDTGLRDELAAEMAQRLSSDATNDCKAFLLQQLSYIGSAQEVPSVAALLGDENLGFYALSVLQRIPAKDASAALRTATEELKGPALVGVINALGEKRDARAVEPIARHLADEDASVAEAAVDALGKIGGPAAAEALRRSAVEAPPARRAMVADALLKCADGLMAVGDTAEAQSIYRSLLAPANPEHVRIAAFVGLASCARAEQTELLLDALSSDDAALHSAAARCIRILGDSKLAKSVAERLTTFRPAVQAQLINALRDLGAAEAVPALANAVSSTDPEVRLAAVRALGRLGGASTYPALMQALRASPSESERQEIESALVRVCRRAESASGALPFGLSDLSAESAPTRSSLLHVLGMLGDAQSLHLLRASLQDPSADTRLAAIRALSEWPDGTPMGDLLAVARSSNDATEKALALGGIAALAPRSQETPEATAQVLSDGMALAQAIEEKRALLGSLAQIRHTAALELARASMDDPSVTEEACSAATQIAGNLGASSKAELQPVMEKVLAVGKSERVRTAAKQILWDLGVPVDVTRSDQLQDPGQNLALGATATSPDDLDKDGAAGGDQAAIDGDLATYWDEVDNQQLYRIKVTFESPQEVSAIRITGHQHHNYAPKDFDIVCDDKVVKTVKDAWYEANQFAVKFPLTRCTSLELRITGYYGLSPAIRELEVYKPAAAAR